MPLPSFRGLGVIDINSVVIGTDWVRNKDNG